MNGSQYMMANEKYYRSTLIPGFAEAINNLQDNSAVMIADKKDPIVALVLSLFLGGLGVDRMYAGQAGLGIAKLVLTIFFIVGWIWVVIDWFLIMGVVKDNNARQLRMMISLSK
jgi:TM2 domain-containing membrane protein YozV